MTLLVKWAVVGAWIAYCNVGPQLTGRWFIAHLIACVAMADLVVER